MGLPGSYSSRPGAEVPPDSSILGVEGLGLGGAKLRVSVCPEFPEGAGEPTSCRGFVLPESLGSPVYCTVVSLSSLPPPHPPTQNSLFPSLHRQARPPLPRSQQEPLSQASGAFVGRNVPECSYAPKSSVCVGVLCFYKLSSLVVIRLKQFSPSVNASLQNHWQH